MSGIPLNVNPVQSDQIQNPQINDSVVSASNMTSSNTTNTNTTTTTTTTTTVSPEEDEIEGSGDEEDDDNDNDTNNNNRDDLTSLLSIGSFITRAALFRRSLETTHSNRKLRQFFSTCNDRITLPCIVEDFISVGSGSVPTCSPVHCGNSLCPLNSSPCRVESTVTPFAIGIHFGDGALKGGAEENIGACMRYKQQNCI